MLFYLVGKGFRTMAVAFALIVALSRCATWSTANMERAQDAISTPIASDIALRLKSDMALPFEKNTAITSSPGNRIFSLISSNG